MKQQVKLSEAQLRRIVAESVNMVLKEFNTRFSDEDYGIYKYDRSDSAAKILANNYKNGNLKTQNNDTPVEESNNDYFRGVKGVRMQYNGNTADPTLSYRGKTANYWGVEDAMWEWYKEECAQNGVQADPNDDEGFNRFCQEHKQDIIDFIRNY